MYRRLREILLVCAWLALAPAFAYAQASITGVVKDSSGAVLPGVTVEAASPALIEKVRTAVTDGTGQYRIENLRPGLYAVAFALAGFNTVKREGIELTGTFTATVNADLRVGALEETITVTGESPLVDVQGTTRQRVMDREVLDAIPSGRTAQNLAGLVPGITVSGGQDVGGVGQQAVVGPSVHASGDTGITINGVSINVLGSSGTIAITRMNPAGTQEVVMDTAAVNAEQTGGGVRINQVPRDGGNTFNGTFFGDFVNHGMQGSNFTQALRDRGARSPNSINKSWDINPGFGGPITRDRLWFYVAAQSRGASQYVSGLFYDRNANNPNVWTFDPDLSRPVSNDPSQKDGQLRLMWQATPRNKIGLTWQESVACYCPETASTTNAIEAVEWRVYPMDRVALVDWTSPITSRLLLEAGGGLHPSLSNILPWPGLTQPMIGVVEQSTGLFYRGEDPQRDRYRTEHSILTRAAVSYITGAHALKVGMNHLSGFQTRDTFDLQTLTYRFNNGVPNQLTQHANPWFLRVNIDHSMGVFVQDKWTVRGLTFAYGARYDYYANSFPEQHVGPAILAPARNITFPEQKALAFHDVTPKMGAAYDPFGTGKTAIKVSLNKYVGVLGGEVLAVAPNPVNNLIVSTTRSWNDANRNFVPDCDLINTAANGECGAMANANFGKTVPGVTYDPDALRGWGHREFNWEFSAGVQQELLPRIAADVSYFRRWFGNFLVTDNLAVAPKDFDPFSITVPVDPRLPSGGGYVVSGLYNLNPAKFGVPASNLTTLSSKYGKQSRYWQGVDITINARPRAGLLLQGGTSTGRTVTDNCDIVGKLDNPSKLYCHVTPAFLTQAKFLGSYTIPRVDVQVSATFQSLPGPQILANYNAPNALVAPSLGRNLSGNAANVTVNLVAPGTMYGERMNQLDVRVGKIVRFVRARANLNASLYNALNANPVLTQNNNFAAWQQPTSILLARFVKLGVQFDF
jgi:hypothetical protein